MIFPKTVELVEVGPRDGLQLEEKIVPTEIRIRWIEQMIRAGLRCFQATSFVNPGLVPQMADAEVLVKNLPRIRGVTYTGLALNLRGAERALLSGLEWIEVSISASDAHSRKNTGMSLDMAVKEGREMIRMVKSAGRGVILGIQCAFGCAIQGTVPPESVKKIIVELTEPYGMAKIDRLMLADTTGMANPVSLKSLLSVVSPLIGKTRLGLHLHDTRGLGLVNVMTALESGIDLFDTSLAGMGGCPFVKGAAGNIATEDTAYLLSVLGIETGIDIGALADLAGEVSGFFGKIFPGRLSRIGSGQNRLFGLQSAGRVL